MTAIPTQRTPERGPRRYARPGMPLSPREIQVLELIAEGASYEQIGTRLEVSIDTVKTHLKKIFSKLDAKNGPHAVAIAIGLRMIYPPCVIAGGFYAEPRVEQ